MTISNTQQKTILVAEDEKDLREALTTALESMGGFAVIAVADGEAALTQSLAKRPNHIILDIHMPKLNGDKVLIQLRQDAWGKGVPVTILTAQSDMNAIASAIEAGGVGTSYLVKSDISLAKVVEHVTGHINT